MADEMNMQEIGDCMDLTRERVRQIIKATLSKVKRRLRLRGITQYSDIALGDAIVEGIRAGNRPRND